MKQKIPWIISSFLVVLGCILYPLFKKNENLNNELICELKSSLKSGDLLFIASDKWRGRIVDLFDKDAPYSHVGIIQISNQEVRVIHSSPYSNKIENEIINDFLKDPAIKQLALYRLRQDGSEKIAEIACQHAQRYYQKKIPFDGAFKVSSGDAFYCTELVWKCYLEAGIDAVEDRLFDLNNMFLKEPIILPSSFLEGNAFIKII